MTGAIVARERFKQMLRELDRARNDYLNIALLRRPISQTEVEELESRRRQANTVQQTLEQLWVVCEFSDHDVRTMMEEVSQEFRDAVAAVLLGGWQVTGTAHSKSGTGEGIQ